MKNQWTHTWRCAAALCLCAALLAGCVTRPGGTDATTAAPYAGQTGENSEALHEKKTAAQAAFQQFTDELFRDEVSSSLIDCHYRLADPAAYGIGETKSLFSEASLESALQDTADLKELKAQLDDFDLALLSDDQKLTLRILQSFTDTELRADGLELYLQPLAPSIGVQAQLPILLAEYEFRSRRDVDDYLKLIAGIDEYYGEILTFEQAKAEAGLMMSDTALDHVIESCESYLLVPGDNFMIETFNTRLDAVEGLTDEEKAAYREQNAALLESDFTPAYTLLIDGLSALKGTGKYEGGLSNYPDGKKYYEYLVFSGSGTSCKSVEEMLASMEALLDDNLMRVTELSKEHPELLEQFDSYQFRQTEPDAILEELKTLYQKDFPALPECSYTFKYVPKALELSLSPAFYLVPPLDDYKNNTIYINQNPRYGSSELYTTIAHEGVPGHLYQNVYFRSKGGDNIRQILSFLGYSEGWATYVERYAYTLDNGLSPEMGEMLAANMTASLGLQACLDVYINYKGWTKDQVAKYLSIYYEDPSEVAQTIYNTMIENPSNYVSYYVGYMEFQKMEETAKKELGDRFDPKAFHTFLLDLGPAPFDVVQPYFTSWLLSQKL